MRRGFKAEAERRSLTERKVLELTPQCRLAPVRLAESKGVPVIAICDLPGVPQGHLRRLHDEDPSAFSAAAVIRDGHALIVVNDAHPPPRQVNSIAHEMAHLLLEHQAVPAFGDFGARTLTKAMEDEADWLAGCLLIPGSGIRATMSACGGDLQVAAEHYGVSIELMRWRFNVTQWKPKRKAA